MREIKFRAWDKLNHKMLPLTGLGWDVKCCICLYDINKDVDEKIWKRFETRKDIENIILMQFTGLKDKNGKEIYEGDIVRNLEWDNRNWLHEVKFGEEYIDASDYEEYCVGVIGFYLTNYLGNKNEYEGLKSSQKLEIIGNIYENPELLTPNG